MTFMTVWSSEPCPSHHLIGHGEIDADVLRVLANLRTAIGEGDCSPIAESPESPIDFGEGVCEERFRIRDLIDEAMRKAL